jgi:hypothetical protein
MYVQIIMAIASLTTTALKGNGFISPNLQALIQSALTILPGLFATKQPNVSAEIAAILGGMATMVTALKADTTIDPVILNEINALDMAIQDVMTADTQAQKLVDPTTLTDIEPLP